MAAAAATAASKGNGGGGGRAGAGEASSSRKKKGPGPLATAYLVIYNVVMTAGWLVIAVGLVRAYLAKGSYHSLYYSIEKPLKFFQTGALLEILHCAIGIVPSSVVLTSFQVMSRVFLIWAVTHSVKESGHISLKKEKVKNRLQTPLKTWKLERQTTVCQMAELKVQSEDSVLLFVIAWTITEIIRYSFYTFSLLNHLPYLIKWARYTLFIVLYPMGVSGELLTIYAALPFVRQAGLYSISLPNKYNFSFDYYAFLILIMISYIPIFPQLYFHMIHQRRKILSHTEEHKKFE
ncbi:very-long-chain (3R)-3-hydroxyacyl-CoA dehydratase 2 isoform X1 [Ovis aries]|uniref:3-hydroxyacyl-CoA dehydratase 2 n=1 Tax=Ovis aries TaxID=9940 RepID=A0AC11E757_SHEEP|nr:very-long-chain (3R)-3-hydroxyacyl-CoA dehydratase 2 isoform X1 [Ovis aries]